MVGSADDYHAYLFRMWRTGPNGVWRASLEDVQTGERVGFGSLRELYGYLQIKVGAPGGREPDTTNEQSDDHPSHPPVRSP